MTALEAYETVALRTQEHLDPDKLDGTGIEHLVDELGADIDDVLLGGIWLVNNGIGIMPVTSLLLGAFVAGASWRAAQERSPAADPPADDEATG